MSNNAINRRRKAQEFRESEDYERFLKQKRLERKLNRGYKREETDSVWAVKPLWKNNNPATIWVFLLIGIPFLLLLFLF